MDVEEFANQVLYLNYSLYFLIYFIIPIQVFLNFQYTVIWQFYSLCYFYFVNSIHLIRFQQFILIFIQFFFIIVISIVITKIMVILITIIINSQAIITINHQIFFLQDSNYIQVNLQDFTIFIWNEIKCLFDFHCFLHLLLNLP